MLISLDDAKRHLYVRGYDKDQDIQLKLDASITAACKFIDCEIFASDTARTLAVALIPAAFTAARADYEAKILALTAIENLTDREMVKGMIEQSFMRAKEAFRKTLDGVVIDSAITAAVLLILGHLFEFREDSAIALHVQEIPNGARTMLHPYRQGMGV